MQYDNIFLLQLFFMIVSSVFLVLVLIKQIKLYYSTITEYTTVRKIILGLVGLAFLGNFSHIEAGHLIHSIQTLVMSIGWWLLYKSIADALTKAEKLKKELEVEALSKSAQLRSVKIHQKAQSEAIAELSPKTQQEINDLTAVKDIAKVAELDKNE